MKLRVAVWSAILALFAASLAMTGCAPDQGGSGNDDDDTNVGNDDDDVVPDGIFTHVQPYEPSADDLEWVDQVAATLDLNGLASELRGVPARIENFSDTYRTEDHDGIRGFQFRDGPRGANLSPYLGDRDGYVTAFPTSSSRGASFDLDLEERIGNAMSEEVLAARATMLLGPCVNLLRHPAWGRAQETYGEDTFHLGRMGTAYTIGAQHYLPISVKHYVANNIEEKRFDSNSIMDEQTLREVYGAIYKLIAQDGGAASMMAAYNSVNGVKSTENRHILTDILRDDYGFQGFVLSDWWAMTNWINLSMFPGDYKNIAAAGINAGMEMELPWALNYAYIEGAVEDGMLTYETVETAAKRVLLQKKRFNIHEPGENVPLGLEQPEVGYDEATGSITDYDEHIALAEEAAGKGMVLMKNSGNVLPIDVASVETIAVVGAVVEFDIGSEDKKYKVDGRHIIDFARDNPTGDLGSSRVWDDPAKGVGAYDGIAAAAGGDAEVVVGNDASAVEGADVAVVVVGLTPEDEGEEYTGAGDRTSFRLDAKNDQDPNQQTQLIADVVATGVPTVVVMIGGSVIDMTDWEDDVQAIVMAWYPGMVGGAALGKLLLGQQNFSGKLPITWADYSQYPEFNPSLDVEMDYFAGYRWFDQYDKQYFYPFGYGLKYSDIEYADSVALSRSKADENDIVVASIELTNNGEMDAEEVVFAFVSYPNTGARRSVKELKGFERVAVPAGSTVTAEVPIRVKDLMYYDMDAESWILEKDEVRVMVGGSADTLNAQATFTVE